MIVRVPGSAANTSTIHATPRSDTHVAMAPYPGGAGFSDSVQAAFRPTVCRFTAVAPDTDGLDVWKGILFFPFHNLVNSLDF